MSASFKEYRKIARRATRELLCCKDNKIIQAFIARINATKSENEISRILTEVREII